MRRAIPVLLLLAVLAGGAGLLAQEKMSPDELLKLGDTYLAEKTFKKAIDAYERFLGAAPEHPEAFRARIGVALAFLGLRQPGPAVEKLKALLPDTKKGSAERARVLHLLGATVGRHWCGKEEVVAWLDEAIDIYRRRKRKDDRVRALFDLGFVLSRSWDYGIDYKAWEKEYGGDDPPKVTWEDYQRERMEKADRKRYDRVESTYRKIIDLAGSSDHVAAQARYLLGCFHVNVLAAGFRTRADYYADLVSPEATEKEEEALARYVAEIRKGMDVWREILRRNRGDALEDDARYLIALTLHRRLNEFREAEAEYEALLAADPGTEWEATARAALQEIRREEIRIEVPGPFLPGTPGKVRLTARNVAKIRFTVHRLDLPALLRGAYRFHRLDDLDLGADRPLASFTVETGVAADHKGVRKEVELPVSEPGAYLLHADGNRRTSRALVVISGIGMAMKTAGDRVLIYSADAVTGEPAAGVEYVVKATWRRGRQELTKLFTGTSGDAGIAEIPVTGIDGRANLEAVGTREGHVVLSQSYQPRASRREAFRVLTETDRPVYRPNQTVHFKTTVRATTAEGYRVADGKPVKVEIRDPRGQVLFDKTLVANRHGTISGDLALAEEPALGIYQFRILIAGRQYYSYNWTGGQFRVEEYKKPEYEVTVSAGDEPVRPGTEVKVKIRGRYYFGAPVAGGEVSFRIERSPYRHFMPVHRRYGWYYEDLFPRPTSYWNRELILEGKGLLDENGELEVGFPAKEYGDDLDSRYDISVSVVDLSRREIRGAATLYSTRQSFFVMAEARRSLMKPGDAVEVTLRAEDANRKPIASQGKLVLAKRVDREVEKDGEKETEIDWVDVGSVPAATRADGEGTASIVVDEEGQFRLSYVTKGSAGEEIRGETGVWVVTRDFAGSQYRFSGVEVVTDRDTYAVGDEVEVLVNSHVPDAAILLTVEAGDRILEHRVVRAKGRSHVETFTVSEGWTPNVWLKALTIRDEAVFRNRRQVIVPPERKFLDVAITPAKEGTWRPGEEGLFTVTAKDAAGEPVPAELSVGFIDKSVLYIQPELTPDIRQFFYGAKRPDGVRLSSSFDFRFRSGDRLKPGRVWQRYRTRGRPEYMNPWFYGFQGLRGELLGLLEKGKAQRRKSEAQGHGSGGERLRRSGAPGAPPAAEGKRMDGGFGAPEESESGGDDFAADNEGGSGGGLPEPEGAARSFFPDTAFWNAHVVTGTDGKAEVRVTFPDSLTTWKATARGATDETAVGAASREFVTKKNVIMRLQAPRFFRERDEVVVSGIVLNDTDAPLATRILVRTEGGCLELLDRGELSRADQTITVGAHKEQRVDWWFRVLRPGAVTIRADAVTEEESDAVSMSFPVYEHGVEKMLALAGSFVGPGGKPAAGGRAELSFDVPEERHEDATELTVTVNPTLAGAVLEALPYLADYPYGCVEQTMSRFLPTVIVRKTLADLGYTLADLGADPSREVPAGYWGRKEVEKLKVLRDEDLERAVAEGVKRLRDFQHGDGAWGWFKTSPRDLYMTAYVVRGLALARDAGAEVDQGVLTRGIAFLHHELERVDPREHDAKGMTISGDLLASVLTAQMAAGSQEGEARDLHERIAGYLFETRDRLGATSRALLAGSLLRLGREEDARIVCENLTDQATIDREKGICRFGRVSGYYRWHDDAVEATAAALRAYLRVKPKSELVPMMVRWLVKNRRGGHWKSTRDTAHAVLALCDYLRVSGELAPELTVRVSVDGRVTKTVEITKANVFTLDNRLTLRGRDLAGGRHVVTIESEGTGNLYFDAHLTYFTREEGIKGAGNEVLLARKVYRVHPRKREVVRKVWVDGKQVERTVTESYEELELLEDGAEVGVGDEIEIVLEATAKNDYRYLVFEDPKAAGFEPKELRSGAAYAGILSYRELRDERVAFFCSRMPQGTHEFRYRVRAEIPGHYHAMPARGYAMYLPEVRGISDEFRVSVTEPGVR